MADHWPRILRHTCPAEQYASTRTAAGAHGSAQLCTIPTFADLLACPSACDPSVVDPHPRRELGRIAGLDHAGDGIRAVVNAESSGRAVVAAVAQAAEGQLAAGARGAGVDVDATGAAAALEGLDGGGVFGKEAGGQAEVGGVGLLEGLLERPYHAEAEERAEDFDVGAGRGEC